MLPCWLSIETVNSVIGPCERIETSLNSATAIRVSMLHSSVRPRSKGHSAARHNSTLRKPGVEVTEDR